MADIELAQEILFNSFYTDPNLNWIIDNKTNFDQKLNKILNLSLKICIPMGHVYFNKDKTAIAVWIPPERVGYHFTEKLQFLYTFWQTCSLKRFFQFLKLILAMDTFHPPVPHSYLLYLGVKKDYQGQGLGGNLLSETIELMNKFGPVQFLETGNPKNVPLYQKIGFKKVEILKCDGDYQLYMMTRDPLSSLKV